MRTLHVYLEGMDGPAGELSRDDSGTAAFRYLRDDLPHPLSISLPVREEPFDDAETRAFFSNLLFESPVKDQILAARRIDPQDFVELLHHVGADCPGAVSCVPQDAGPIKAPGRMERDYDPLGSEDLSSIVRSLASRRRLPDHVKEPSPLAGIQSKVALTRLPDGCLAMPKPGSGAPTTHILKVPRLADQAHVEQEHIAMDMMRRIVDHPVAETEILETAGLKSLLIKRFDRKVDADTGEVRRFHQEDFCQALGLHERFKYERYGTGAQKFDSRAIGRVLACMAQPGAARLAFFENTLASLALGNTDAHGKNHAILHTRDGPKLAPVYDVLPAILHDVRHDMAFGVGNAIMADDIASGDIEAFLKALGWRRASRSVIDRGAGVLRRLLDLLRDPADRLPKRISDAAAQSLRWLAPALGIDDETPDFDLVPLNRIESWE